MVSTYTTLSLAYAVRRAALSILSRNKYHAVWATNRTGLKGAAAPVSTLQQKFQIGVCDGRGNTEPAKSLTKATPDMRSRLSFQHAEDRNAQESGVTYRRTYKALPYSKTKTKANTGIKI